MKILVLKYNKQNHLPLYKFPAKNQKFNFKRADKNIFSPNYRFPTEYCCRCLFWQQKNLFPSDIIL